MNQARKNSLERRVFELRAELSYQDPTILAKMCDAKLIDGRMQMDVWQTAVTITTSDFIAREATTGAELDLLTQAIIAYYLHTSDGTPPAYTWIAFSELPEGRFYTQAFQGYTGRELAMVFGDDMARFTATAVVAGGRSASFADAAFRFQVLPHVPIMVVCWLGDEDLPSSYKILFDAHVHHQLPTDACAILGSMLTQRLLRYQETSYENSN